MKAKIYSITGEKKTEIELPAFFSENVREDLISKVFKAEIRGERQSYASAIMAGKRASAPGKIRHKRRAYKTAYGYGISRVPRKVLTRRGRRFYWQGAFSPNTVGGRRAHPPKAEKVWELKINKKEKEKALKSALASTAITKLIVNNYKNSISNEFPIIVERKIEELNKIKELKQALLSILKTDSFFPTRKVRAGKGKMRGRKNKKSAGLLLVVSKASKLKSIKAFDIKQVKELSVKDLSLNGKPGRLTIYSHAAITDLEERFKGKGKEKQ